MSVQSEQGKNTLQWKCSKTAAAVLSVVCPKAGLWRFKGDRMPMKKIQCSAFFILLVAALGAGSAARAEEHRGALDMESYIGFSIGRFQGGAEALFGQNQAAGTAEFSGEGLVDTSNLAHNIFLGFDRDVCECLPGFSWGLEVSGTLLDPSNRSNSLFRAELRDPTNIAAIRAQQDQAAAGDPGDPGDPYVLLVNGPAGQGLQTLVNNDNLPEGLENSNLISQNGSFSLDHKSTFSLYLKLGWNWNKWYFYGLGGVSENRYSASVGLPPGLFVLADTELNTNVDATAAINGTAFAAGDLDAGRLSKGVFSTVSGNIGAGIRYRVTPRFSATFQYLHVKGEKKTLRTQGLLDAYTNFRRAVAVGNTAADLEDEAIAGLDADTQAEIQEHRDGDPLVTDDLGVGISATEDVNIDANEKVPAEILASIRNGIELDFDNREQFELVLTYRF